MTRKLRIAIDPGDPSLCMDCGHLCGNLCLVFNKYVEMHDYGPSGEWEARLPECKAGETMSPDCDRSTVVEVDCGEKRCDGCAHLAVHVCGLLPVDSFLAADHFGAIRDSKCLAAEVAG